MIVPQLAQGLLSRSLSTVLKRSLTMPRPGAQWILGTENSALIWRSLNPTRKSSPMEVGDHKGDSYGLVKHHGISIVKALEILQSVSKPSNYVNSFIVPVDWDIISLKSCDEHFNRKIELNLHWIKRHDNADIKPYIVLRQDCCNNLYKNDILNNMFWLWGYHHSQTNWNTPEYFWSHVAVGAWLL